MAISSMKPCFTNEMPLVGGARSAPTGIPNGATFWDVTSTFSTKPRGNSFAGTTEFVLGTKSRYAMSLPLASRPALKKWNPVGRYWSCAMSSSRDHSSLTGTLGRPAATRSSVTSRAIRATSMSYSLTSRRPKPPPARTRWNVTFSGGMPAPSAGCCLDGIWLGDQISSFPSLEVRRGVLRLERRMRQQREEVLRFDGLRRRAECRLDVADDSAGRAAGTAAPSARGRWRWWWRWRGCRRRRRLGRQLARLRQVRLTALRRNGAFVPDDLQRGARVVGEPPAVGHDRHARGEGVIALPRRLDDERVLDARQLLDLVQVGADDLPAEDVALHQHRMEHVRKRDVDAEDRATRHDVQVVDAADPLADDLEVPRILERGLDGGGFRHGQARRRRRQ